VNKSYTAKAGHVSQDWLLVDATDLIMGRLAARVAAILRGKHKPTYTPNVDAGDFVIIVNAEKVKVTSDKLETKIHYSHSGYPGGFKERTLGTRMAKDAAETLRQVIKGMLPHNALGRKMALKLKVYSGPTHPHEAQGPTDITSTLVQQMARKEA
jgi:large subunit ribosomal protein L13